MRKNEGGFSFTELSVVLGLILLFSALSVPILSRSFAAWQSRSDAQNISTVLLQAKFRATSTATKYKISFDAANNSWSLQRHNVATGTWTIEGAARTLGSGLYNSGIHIQSTSSSAPTGFPTSSSAEIMFNTRGVPIVSVASPIPTGNNVVYVTGGQANYAITVSMIGRVQLWRQDGVGWVAE